MRLPAVVLLIFNRPECTTQVWQRIRAARPKQLFVVADGPRPPRPDDVRLCKETRKIVETPDWPCELQTNFSDTNMGCRQRVSSGLDWVFDQVLEAIILEDDCVPSPSFFPFCARLLERYRDDTRVTSISGSNLQLGRRRGSADYYFSRITHIWGWATWRRAWRQIDIDLGAWPEARNAGFLSSVLRDPRVIAYWTDIFDKTRRREIDSWGYPWFFTCLTRNGLTAVPNTNLVTNIGIGSDATHTKGDSSALGIPAGELWKFNHPAAVVHDEEADRFHWERHLLGNRNWISKVRNSLAIRTRLRRLWHHASP